MKKHWYIIADRAKLRIYEQEDNQSSLQLIKTKENPEGTLKDGEINTDKDGQPANVMFDSYQTSTSPSEHVTELWAKEIASILDSDRMQNKFDSLVLVMGPEMLGKVRQELSDSAQTLVREELTKNYSQVPDHAMKETLEPVLCK